MPSCLTLLLILTAVFDGPHEGLKSVNPLTQREALLALDKTNELKPGEVVPFLDAVNEPLRTAALEITVRHGWTKEALQKVAAMLPEMKTEPQRQAVSAALAALLKEPTAQAFVTDQLKKNRGEPATRRFLLGVLQRFAGDAPEAWIADLKDALEKGDIPTRETAIRTIAIWREARLFDDVRTIARNAKQPERVRLLAFGALPAGEKLESADFPFLLRYLEKDAVPLDRLSASRAIGSAAIDGNMQVTLASKLPNLGPVELPALLPAFEKVTAESLGRMTLQKLGAAPGVANVGLTQWEKTFAHWPMDLKPGIEAFLQKRAKAQANDRAKLADWIAKVQVGDIERGRKLFTTGTVACSACHRVQGDGGRTGPDLSMVGRLRSRTELLESILLPAARITPGYESVRFQLKDGKSVDGLVVQDTGDRVTIRTLEQQEVRLLRSEIAESMPSPVSIMPSGLETQTTPKQMGDLLAYLMSLK